MQKKYRLLKLYQTPCRTIYPNVIKTAEEWIKIFPELINIHNLEVKKDWFEEEIEYTPYKVGNRDQHGNILSVTRLVDDIYFFKGMYVKMPNRDQLGFIYSFEERDGRLIIEHTFSYLMNQMGIKDHLKELRPCIYTKEDLIKL